MKKTLLLFLLFGSFNLLAGPGPGGEVIDDKKPVESKETSLKTEAFLKTASRFDAALSQHLSKKASLIKPDFMLDLKEEVSESASDDRSMASSLMSYLDNNPGQVRESLNWDDLTVLPVGLKKKLGDNSTLTIGILSAQFYPTHAELTVFIRLNSKVNSENSTIKERDLFFGVEGITLTKAGGMADMGFKAVLLGDYLLPYKDWVVKLKGGVNKSIVPSDNDTERCYVKFDCGGFESLNVAADIIIPRDKLVPTTIDGTVIDDESVRVTVSGLRVTTDNGLRDIVFSSGAITPFALPKHTEYAFKVDNLAFDLSDYNNPNSLPEFPQGYVGDTDSKWQGLYVGSFEIIFPPEFEDKDSSNLGNRVAIEANNVYWDRTGFSGYISATNQNKKVNASKWTLSLQDVEIGFLQSKFKSGSFAGGVETPIHKDDTESKLFAYEASIYLGQRASGDTAPGERSNYTLVVSTEKTMPLDLFFAKGTIKEGSQVILDLDYTDKYRFKPSAVLSGTMKIGASTDKDENSASRKYEPGKGISLGEIEFERLKIETDPPYVTVESFKYSNSDANNFLNFPVNVTKFQEYQGTLDGLEYSARPEGELWTEVAIKLDLFKGKIGGDGRFIVVSEYVDNGTDVKLRAKRIAVRRVGVKGSFPAVSIDGYLDVHEDASKKEISGGLTIAVLKPTPFEAGLSVLFASTKGEPGGDYKYGFIDSYVYIGGAGIPVGPTNLYGAGLAVYWNMSPEFSSYSPTPVSGSPCRSIGDNAIFSYCPDPSILFGVRMMAAVKDQSSSEESAYKVRLYLDFALNDNFGINHISIYGNGVIGGNFADGDSEEGQLTNAIEVMDKAENNDGAGNSQASSIAKAEDLNKRINGGSDSSPPKVTIAGQTKASAKIAFTAGLMLDIPNNTFHLEAEAFVNTEVLKGSNTNSSAGKLAIHFGPDDYWYIHLGKSYKGQRISLTVRDFLTVDAYLMMGRGVPPFPAPDRDVLNFFPDLRNRFTGDTDYSVKEGTAFALGGSVNLGFDKTGKYWYASGSALAGMDILVSNNSNCSFKDPGDWYGQGQMYALVRLKAGIKNKKGTKRRQLVNVGAGIYSSIRAPKPFGFDAEACIEVPRWVPGKRKKCIQISVGEDC